MSVVLALYMETDAPESVGVLMPVHYDQLASESAVLHCLVRFSDLIQVIDVRNRNRSFTLFYCTEKLGEHVCRQVVRSPAPP